MLEQRYENVTIIIMINWPT